jgi:sugar/nucleoside kinase (ribokinase family)
MSGPFYDVLGLGCTAVDDLLYISSYPPPDSKMQVRERQRQCGGLTATALVAAARLGSRCAFAGVLGQDNDSQFIMDSFRREGVDVRHVISRPDARPIHSTIIVDESCRTRTIFYDLAGSTGADSNLPPDDVIRSTQVLFVDHYGIEGMTRAARIARAAGIPVVADLERSEWPGFDGLLALVDHLILSLDFAAKLTGAGDAPAAASRLWTNRRRAVVITCGVEGCWYLGDGGPATPRRHPAFPVHAVDTTGCGDVFHGAYASALARGLPLAERIRFASAAAALKATRTGGHTGIPHIREVEKFLHESISHSLTMETNS